MSEPGKTQPTRLPSLSDFQPIRIERGAAAVASQGRRRRGCLGWVVLLALVAVYFLAPFRTNILVLGSDDSPARGELGRSDTIILTTVVPLIPYVGMLGIPRDLWVNVPGVGEQRINTAYFFAEAENPGSGGRAAAETVRQNFGVSVDYTLTLHMLGLVDVIDALDGVDITLEQPQGGLGAGSHHLNGTQALAFVRERYSADDFARMQQGQIVIIAAIKKSLNPTTWPRLPKVIAATGQAITTDIPAWQWPRLGFAIGRGILLGLDNRTISREMVTPFQTSQGAQVLAPNWEAINPMLLEMFGQ